MKMTIAKRIRSSRVGWISAALLGGAIALGGASLLKGPAAGGPGLPEGLVETVRADIGKGDYLFLPNRKDMWVVNRANGKLIHYEYKDNLVGTVEHSQVSQLDQAIFPPADTEFMLSDRNLTGFLWVANRVTGDFQVWRANRDSTLSTDELPVPAGEDLRAEARKTSERTIVPVRRPGPPPSSGSGPTAPTGGRGTRPERAPGQRTP
jgi:hypothetical protein